MKKIFSKWLLLGIAGVVAFSLGLANAAYAESTLDKIKARGQLIAGVGDHAPFAYKASGEDYAGFDVDVTRYIANKLGVKIKFVYTSGAGRITLLENSTVDLVASTFTHTKTRDAEIDFSITYFYDGQKLLVKKGSGIKSYRDLAGKKVGTTQGTTSERTMASVQPEAKIVSFERLADAFRALKDGVVDAVTNDSTLLLGLKVEAENPDDYEITGEFFSEEPYGLGLPQNDSKWRTFVNECLIEMWNSGEWLKIYNKYFGPGQKYALPLDFKMSTWPLR